MRSHVCRAAAALMFLCSATLLLGVEGPELAPDTLAEDLLTYAGPGALRDLLQEKADALFLVDVRSEGEYVGGHLPGALHIDYQVIAAQPPTVDKDAPIILYCRSGARAGVAERALIDAGYTRVFNWGGIIDWPYEVVTGPDPYPPE
jgi:phage shock protein E